MVYEDTAYLRARLVASGDRLNGCARTKVEAEEIPPKPARIGAAPKSDETAKREQIVSTEPGDVGEERSAAPVMPDEITPSRFEPVAWPALSR